MPPLIGLINDLPKKSLCLKVIGLSTNKFFLIKKLFIKYKINGPIKINKI